MKKTKVADSPDVAQTARTDLNKTWNRVVRRRSFLQGLGMLSASTMIPASALLLNTQEARADSRRRLPRGDVAILRLLAAAELIESDLWVQYAELGGVKADTPDEEFQGFVGGNPAYAAALENLDEDMPQYITDNTDDEISHARFLNAYLVSRGERPVNLDKFRTLPGSGATGVNPAVGGRLTNLMNLNVDLSWYTRYRSNKNADLGATFQGPFTIKGQPAIPLNDTETPPDQTQPVPPATLTPAQERMQAIANTAGFHFAFIEQGGSSLYNAMSLKVTDLEVLRIVVSIGGVEVDHFGLWHDKAGNAVADPLAGITDPITGLKFPNLNDPATELTQTNKVLPEPCEFIRKGLPNCSVIRPDSQQNAGAVAAIQGFIDDNLFQGQSDEFFTFVLNLAKQADAARRKVE